MHDFITTAEAAELVGRSQRTLEKWRQLPPGKRRIPFTSDGYRVWYRREDVLKYIDESMATFPA